MFPLTSWTAKHEMTKFSMNEEEAQSPLNHQQLHTTKGNILEVANLGSTKIHATRRCWDCLQSSPKGELLVFSMVASCWQEDFCTKECSLIVSTKATRRPLDESSKPAKLVVKQRNGLLTWPFHNSLVWTGSSNNWSKGNSMVAPMMPESWVLWLQPLRWSAGFIAKSRWSMPYPVANTDYALPGSSVDSGFTQERKSTMGHWSKCMHSVCNPQEMQFPTRRKGCW